MWVYSCVCIPYVSRCLCMCKSDVNFLRSHPIPLVVLGHDLSLIWGSLIKLAGPGAPGTQLSLPSQFWNYKHAPSHLAISSTDCRDGTKVLLLSGQHSQSGPFPRCLGISGQASTAALGMLSWRTLEGQNRKPQWGVLFYAVCNLFSCVTRLLF